MSNEGEVEIIKMVKGWNWEARITAGVAFVSLMAFIVSFYFNTNNTNERQDRYIKELEDKITRMEVVTNSKVSIQQFEDFRSDMKTDMRDLKMAIMKNYDKK